MICNEADGEAERRAQFRVFRKSVAVVMLGIIVRVSSTYLIIIADMMTLSL